MSHKSEIVTAAHLEYLARLTRQEDAFLKQLKAAALAAGLPEIWIAPEQASFLQILLRLQGARQVVEVGTLGGYSAIAMARALPPEGRVRSIEIQPEHADFARQWIARSDVADKVEVLLGDGRQVLPQFRTNSMDAAFLDADKAGYSTYLRECRRIVRPGGLILADNAFAFGQILEPGPVEESVHHLRAFNQEVAREAELQAVIVPLGDGCWVMVNVKPA